jgi:glycosyltransferase involved in cell wall biosynthesis
VKYLAKPNGGKGSALNFGINKARGEVVVTMDADTAFSKDAIERLVLYFRDPTIDAVVGNVKVAENDTLVGWIQQLEYLFGFYFKRAHAFLGAEYIFGGACAAFRKEECLINTAFDTHKKLKTLNVYEFRFHGEMYMLRVIVIRREHPVWWAWLISV